MVPKYDVSPASGPFIQGELIEGIHELRPLYPPIKAQEDLQVEFYPIPHPLAIVMNPACDLEWDYKARFESGQIKEINLAEVEISPSLIHHILMCNAYTYDQIRPGIAGDDIIRRIKDNRENRYHYFPSAPIGDDHVSQLPELFIDFKKSFALPCSGLYEGLRRDGIKRRAVIPVVYIHDLIQRYYGFMARVGLPTPSLISVDVTPRVAKIGDTITLNYSISNPGLNAQNVKLHASIRSQHSGKIVDVENIVNVNIPPGRTNTNRNFKIANTVIPGVYEVIWGLSNTAESPIMYEERYKKEYLIVQLPRE